MRKAPTAATSGSARSAPTRCSQHCAPPTCRWPASPPAATARPTRSPTTPPPPAAPRTAASSSPPRRPRRRGRRREPARRAAEPRRGLRRRDRGDPRQGPIQFATGAATIAPASQPIIDAIAAALRQCPDVAIEIGGHTNSMGSDAGNQRLSQARADAVLAALRARPAPARRDRPRLRRDRPCRRQCHCRGPGANRRIAFNLVTAEGQRRRRWIGVS